jgi:hypothetical protein
MLPEGVLTANGISCENSSLSRSPLKRVLHRKGQEASFPTRSESLYFHWVVEGSTCSRMAHQRRGCHSLDAGVKPRRSDLKYGPNLGPCF